MTIIDFGAYAAQRGIAVPSGAVGSPRLVELTEDYRRYLVGESRRAEGVARYLWGYRRFAEWMGEGATVQDVQHAEVLEYKEYLANERKAAPPTIINALAVIKDFSAFCVLKGYRTDDPTAGIKRPKKQRPKPKPLYPYEIEEMLDAIRMPPWLRESRRWYWARNRRLVYLLLYSGLRLSEAANLCWSDIHLQVNVISVRAEHAKNGKERLIKLHARLKAILETVPVEERAHAVAGRKDHGCLTERGMAKIFTNWLQDELKFTNVHAHRLRHSFACLMLWNKADLKTIQELLGHNQLGTTEWYLEAREEEKQQAIDHIPDFGV